GGSRAVLHEAGEPPRAPPRGGRAVRAGPHGPGPGAGPPRPPPGAGRSLSRRTPPHGASARAGPPGRRRPTPGPHPGRPGRGTGSGKGVLARWLHDNGPRAEEAFVDLNCAGLARELLESELFGHQKGAFTGAIAAKPGLLETAHRGTMFLDEIGDVDAQIQGKL